MVAEGERVVTRWRTEGVLCGDWPLEPWGTVRGQGQSFTWTGISIMRVVDGKIVQEWEQTRRVELAQQLGLLPPSS